MAIVGTVTPLRNELPPGGSSDYDMFGHTFTVERVEDSENGRPRYKLACLTCKGIIGASLSAPIANALSHVRARMAP